MRSTWFFVGRPHLTGLRKEPMRQFHGIHVDAAPIGMLALSGLGDNKGKWRFVSSLTELATRLLEMRLMMPTSVFLVFLLYQFDRIPFVSPDVRVYVNPKGCQG